LATNERPLQSSFRLSKVSHLNTELTRGYTDRLPSGKLSSISLLFSLNPCGLVLELSSMCSLH
jgi:hypothetical protein